MSTAGTPLWDIPTRIMHWGLAGSVTVCLITGFLMPPDAMIVHYWSGGVAAAVVLARLVWGLVGPQHSRFRHFPVRPADLISHGKSALARKAAHWDGHPPLGALMVLLLLIGVAATATTGAVALGGAEKTGPLASFFSFSVGHDAAEVHEVLGLLILILVGGHLAGIFVESRLMRENLAKSMITGHRDAPARMTAVGRPILGLGLIVVLLGIGGTGAWALAQRPAFGVRDMAYDPLYAKECGACHMLYHPTLLPADSWRGLIATLDDHFGEDASLKAADIQALTQWLTKNAGETWDLKAAHALSRINPEKPWQITATPFWIRKHDDIAASVFKTKPVRTAANCIACHADARAGTFALTAIDIPETAQ